MTEEVTLELIKGVVTVIVALITGAGAYVGGNHLIKRGSSNESERMKLSNHPLFARVELNKNVILTHFRLENKGKEVVFKEILIRHMEIYKKHALDLCANVEDGNIADSQELYNKSVETLSSIIKDLSQFYKFDNMFSDEERMVLDIVMSKYNHWNYDREKEIMDRIGEVCGSAFYPDTYTKAVTVLDSFLFAMNDTVSDANKTLNSINGDLKGLKFRGVVI